MDFTMQQRLLPGMKPRPSLILMDKQDLSEVVQSESPATFVFIKNCANYSLQIEGKAAKIMLENCRSVKLDVERSLVSGTLELLRSQNVSIRILDEIPILHIDDCKNISIEINSESQLKSVYFQRTKEIKVHLLKDENEKEFVVETDVEVQLHDVDEIAQWVAHWNGSMSAFVTERVCRNGIYLSQVQMQPNDQAGDHLAEECASKDEIAEK